jgi:hypothetical protein
MRLRKVPTVPRCIGAHFECFKSHFLASRDADLQLPIQTWSQVDDSMWQSITDAIELPRCTQNTNRSFWAGPHSKPAIARLGQFELCRFG